MLFDLRCCDSPQDIMTRDDPDETRRRLLALTLYGKLRFFYDRHRLQMVIHHECRDCLHVRLWRDTAHIRRHDILRSRGEQLPEGFLIPAKTAVVHCAAQHIDMRRDLRLHLLVQKITLGNNAKKLIIISHDRDRRHGVRHEKSHQLLYGRIR